MSDTVSRELFAQIKWERDIAIQQLKDLGYELGEKPRTPSAEPEIIRCKDCMWKNNHNCTRAVEVCIDDDKFCAWAERRTDAAG